MFILYAFSTAKFKFFKASATQKLLKSQAWKPTLRDGVLFLLSLHGLIPISLFLSIGTWGRAECLHLVRCHLDQILGLKGSTLKSGAECLTSVNPYFISNTSVLAIKIPILQMKELRLRKMIKYICQEYTQLRTTYAWFQILCSYTLCYSFSPKSCEIYFPSRILVEPQKKRSIFNKVRNTGIKEHGTFDLHFKITREYDENNKKHII